MMPFDNFIFAPSRGWAAIAPIAFFIYAVVNISYLVRVLVENRGFVAFVIIYLIVCFLNLFLVEPSSVRILDAAIPFVLGVSMFYAFYIFFVLEDPDLNSVVKCLIISYSVSLIIGWLTFASLKLKLDSIIEFLASIQKRAYFSIRGGRIAFTFTEPSYISGHLYGVLLLFWKLTMNRNLKRLIIIFAISGCLISGSVRMILDTAVVSVILLLSNMNIKKVRTSIYLLLTITIGLPLCYFAYSTTPRIQRIVDKGIYGDGSLATRYFSFNATVIGYKHDILHTMLGYGLGNSRIPLRAGYQEAFSKYKNSYDKEILALGRDSGLINTGTPNYDIYTVLISEIGFISFACFLVAILRKGKENRGWMRYIFIVGYIYMQWGTLAFYSLWLLLIFIKRDKYPIDIKMTNSEKSLLNINNSPLC
jgi:hypothetical protein